MPGVIMENGGRNGAHTNHDREAATNGANGNGHPTDRSYEKSKSRPEAQQPAASLPISNGINGTGFGAAGQQPIPVAAISRDVADQIQQLPPEILHITEGFESLPELLQRLAQVTHNQLTMKIKELAEMPVPASAVNGNSGHLSLSGDDNSVANISKKVKILKFAEDTHANWTKALVITQWSRVSEDIGKLVDLKVHLDSQKGHYDWAVHEMSEMKRSLVPARLPNPDLKTAVEILSTGKASWMPDLGYIEPPLLTAGDLIKSLDNLNTLLSIRLNVHEYDKIPLQLKDFTIKSGRATFRVAGEFELDLTIADENPDAQFWFIDFRFLFSPSPAQLPEHLRYLIEGRVNAALEHDGLAGCYKFLHELTLTHKIGELRRQASELSRRRWIDTLRVEPLNRGLSIQYWADRYGRDGPKSWILLGVHSGKRKDGRHDPKATSRIDIRWFRDGKEVKDPDIQLELDDLSAETLVQNVIDRHIFHILNSTYSKLRARALYANRELSLSFGKASEELTELELKVQLTTRERISVTIEPVTGRFGISPSSRLAIQAEFKLNSMTRDPASNANDFIENMRCVCVSEEVISRAISVGWLPIRSPGLKQEDLKPIVPRDTLHLSWFRRAGWNQDWLIAFSSSMSGERWWLIQTEKLATGISITSHFQIPMRLASPSPTYTFLTALHLFAAAMISQYTNMRALHSQKAMYKVQDLPLISVSSPMKLSGILINLSDLLQTRKSRGRHGKPWAKSTLRLTFQGLQLVQTKSHPSASTESQEKPKNSLDLPDSSTEHTNSGPPVENAIIIAQAAMSQPMPSSLDLVKQRVDRDIAFHPTSGAFAFRLQSKVGESSVPELMERLNHVEQLVQFIAVAKKHEKTFNCENISLGRVDLSYGSDRSQPTDPNSMAVDKTNTAYRAAIDFAGKDNEMTLELHSGNPHIRVLDHLTKILNSPVGLDGFATYIPLTLPLLRAFDTLEGGWAALDEHGYALVFSRAIDWYTIRYTLNNQPTPEATDVAPSSNVKSRNIDFEVKLQHRGRQPWWWVRRSHERITAQPGGDEVDIALSKVWNDNSEGENNWRGMQNAAIARDSGVEILMAMVDGVMREIAANPIPVEEPLVVQNPAQQPPPAAAPAPAQNQGQKPSQQQGQQQRQTQSQYPAHKPTQNQNQARNQQQMQQQRIQQMQQQQQLAGRKNQRHEMIVID